MSEQDIITQFFSHHKACGNVNISIGDDAAVVTPPKDSRLAITTDILNEGIHFHASCPPEYLGHKVLAVSLSDLAAMGATPLWATINLSLPKIRYMWLDKFSQGLFLLADLHDVKIIGGDLVRGPLSISVQAIGYLNADNALTRSNAEIDDLIFVSGTIGDATLGLKLHEWEKILKLSQAEKKYLALRFNKPEPRVDLGIEIAKLANAAIDISDGLLIDLQRILSMSKVGATIDIEKIPLSKPMQRQINNLQNWSLPLTGGDDYELIFTAEEKNLDEISYVSKKLNCPITEIGRIVKGENIELFKAADRVDLPDNLGFDHFA